LGAALHEQQKLSIATGELAAARFEMTQYASLAKALDASRAKVEMTMRELAQQASRLEAARGQAEKAARAKDEFLAMLGHELRNPLAPMVTVLQVLRLRGEWTPELAIMQRQVDHMQRLVDDLLDVARIAGGKLTLQRRRIELVEVVRSALETAEPLVLQKRQHVCIDVPDCHVRVDADPARLAQVFANLITNASKYSDEGTSIRVQSTIHNDKVLVEVIDQGVGIEADMLERVFDLFEQQGTSSDRARGGLGLGLAIVRNLVQHHGGHVFADSAGLGKGSRFVVELPLASGEVMPEKMTGPRLAPVLQPGARILLVDDNADARDTLAKALRLAGYTVEVAVDGPGALECARVFEPRLALLDIGMPGMDGYELASRLRNVGKPGVKLVALTGYGQPNDRQRALDSGFDQHLVKPVDFPHLQAVIETLQRKGDGGN
jgi:signal transduction histidine kinase/ActR/RegA family two-component response regulator